LFQETLSNIKERQASPAMHGTPEFPPLSEGSEGRAAENPSNIPNVSKVESKCSSSDNPVLGRVGVYFKHSPHIKKKFH